jgi:quaternary ammonium compound-resistance protein SugE
VAIIYLLVAGLLEIVFALALKSADGFTRGGPVVTATVAALTSLFFLSLALRTVPLGTAYAVWTGIGTAGTAIAGIVILREAVEPVRLACIGLILCGAIGLQLIQHANR